MSNAIMPPSGLVTGIGGVESPIIVQPSIIVPILSVNLDNSLIDISTCQMIVIWIDLTFGDLVAYRLKYKLIGFTSHSVIPSFFGYDTTDDNWQFLNAGLEGLYELSKAKVGATVKAMFVIPTHGAKKITLSHVGVVGNTSSLVTVKVSRNWSQFQNYQEGVVL